MISQDVTSGRSGAVGYYPGCSLSGTAAEYDRSLRAVACHMGVELREVPDWVCCGATSAHALDREAALCMAADTLAKAARAGLTRVLAPCAMCFQRLAIAAHEMQQHGGLAARLADALGLPADAGLERVRPLSVLKFFAEMGEDAIRACVKAPLGGIKVACYYGCLLVRPGSITGEREVEEPRGMEMVVRALGAQPVRWSMATECCGGSFAISRKEAVLRLSRRVCDSARRAGADVICLACPMCHSNLDMRQAEFNRPGESALPVVYLTQLMGLAMGIDRAELGLEKHFVPVKLQPAAV